MVFFKYEQEIIIGTIGAKMVGFPLRNINIQIGKLREGIFLLFYTILRPNLAVLLILRCSFELW